MQYSLSYLVATSAGGAKASADGGTEPIDITVSMNIDIREYPKIKAKPIEHEEEEHTLSKPSV